MKRTISMFLAVLMLLPLIASMAFAVSPDDVVITDEPTNVAHVGEFSITSGFRWSEMNLDALVDGDKEYGTASPKGSESAIKLDFGTEFFITEVTLTVNGKGTIGGKTYDQVVYDTAAVKVNGYDKKNQLVTKNDTAQDTLGLEEITITIDENVQYIEVVIFPEDGSEYCTLWEMEAYATTAPIRCKAEQENIASTALLDSTVYDSKTNTNVHADWWAMDLTRMIDGNIHTGTHTVKSGAFSLWLYFGQERQLSEVIVHTNGYGTMKSGTGDSENTANFKDELGQPLGEGVNFFNSYEVTIVLYDFNDDVVYESEKVDVTTLTEYVAQAGVSAATVEIKISNAGSAGQGGSIYIWDVEVMEEKGEHIYEQVSQESPQCGVPGYRQYKCIDENCQMTKIESIPETGFHTWDEGKIYKDATSEANGIKRLMCTICGQTVDRDVPALRHTWDEGTVTEPYCDEGYTTYKCIADHDGNKCNLTYTSDYTIGIGHKFDDGVLKEKATTQSTGEMIFTCQRPGCGYEHKKVLRKAKYIDNTFKVDGSIVKRYESYQTVDTTVASDAYAVLGKYVFDGVTNEGVNGTSGGDYWFAPGSVTGDVRNSGFLYIYLDKEYYFTRGTLYAAASYRHLEVHFQYQNESGEWITSASYVNDRHNTMTVAALDMTGSLNQGARASRIAIESVNGDCGIGYVSVPQGSPNSGGRLQIHEIELEAHKCELTPEDYEPEANWKPATCTPDGFSHAGSCKATCAVCGIEATVELDPLIYAHKDRGPTNVITEPTCLLPGLGQETCNVCDLTIDVEIEPTGEHDYSGEYEFIAPECSKSGLGQKVCTICNDVNYQYPIAPTGEHKYSYITKSQANYTAVGIERYACEYCKLQGDKEDVITEKLPVPENFVTFLGYSIRMTDYVGLRASFKFDREILNTLEETCDVTITIYAKDVSSGKVVSAQAYGRDVYYSGTEKFNENCEFSAVAKVSGCKTEYEFSYEITLSNFRGTESKTVNVPGYAEGKTTTSVSEIANVMLNDDSLAADVKKFLKEVKNEK